MIMRQILVLFLAAMVLTGCGLFSRPAPEGEEIFAVAPQDAKVFVYAVYDPDAHRPWLPDTFRVHLDGGFIASIGEDEYIAEKTLPGNTEVKIDLIGWGGFVDDYGAFTGPIKSGEPSFIGIHIGWDEKLDKRKVDVILENPMEGLKNVTARKRVCSC